MSSTPPSRIALVTGASSGIGRAASISLSKSGWTVVLSARRKDALEETAKAMSGASRVVPGDLGKAADIKELFKVVQREFGRLDLLFNNAGMSNPKTPLEDIPLDDFQQVMNVNVTASFLCAQEAVRIMKAQTPKGGRIINNGSISAYAPRPCSVPYTMSKHAISGLTKCIALDGREHHIACSQIDIGNAQTAITSSKGSAQPNGETMVEPNYDVGYAGEAVAYMANLPLGINVLNQTLMATNMPFVGRG